MKIHIERDGFFETCVVVTTDDGAEHRAMLEDVIFNSFVAIVATLGLVLCGLVAYVFFFVVPRIGQLVCLAITLPPVAVGLWWSFREKR